MENIRLSIDSTCDLNSEILENYNIAKYPYTIIIGDKSYKDNIDIKPADIFEIYRERKILPKTAAINISEYLEYFKGLGDSNNIIHINLASSLTSAHTNCKLAADQASNVYPIDSQNLSSGSGLLVLKAARLIESGLAIDDILKELEAHKEKIHMSFLLDTLDFLHAGGRCSKVTSLGANLLKIKPVINVDNKSGAMSLGSKYKGSLEKALKRYINNKLGSTKNINTDHMFLVHSGVNSDLIDMAKAEIMKNLEFDKIYVSQASCTISSHCGPNTIGLAFETN